MAGERFTCDDCEHSELTFNEAHTRMHTIVRISEKAEEELSMDERLRLIEDELMKMRQLLAELVERGVEGSPNDPLRKGGLRAAAIEEPEEAPGTAENV